MRDKWASYDHQIYGCPGDHKDLFKTVLCILAKKRQKVEIVFLHSHLGALFKVLTYKDISLFSEVIFNYFVQCLRSTTLKIHQWILKLR